MATRSRLDFAYGIASGIVNGGQTTITGTNWPTPVAGTYVPVVLNPGYYGATGTQEIIYVTSSGTSTVAIVQRQAEGGFGPVTTGVSGTVPWVAGPLITDFGIINQINNGDFPSPTASGQFFISSASGTSSAPYWSNFIPAGSIQYIWDTNYGAATYIANSTDINNIVQISGSCAIQLPASGIGYGQQVTFIQMTSGTVTFSGGASIYSTGSLNNGNNPQLRQIYSTATAIWIGNQIGSQNVWVVTGDII